MNKKVAFTSGSARDAERPTGARRSRLTDRARRVAREFAHARGCQLVVALEPKKPRTPGERLEQGDGLAGVGTDADQRVENTVEMDGVKQGADLPVVVAPQARAGVPGPW